MANVLALISAITSSIAVLGVVFVGLELLQQSRTSKSTFIDSLAESVDKYINTELLLDRNGRLNTFQDSLSADCEAELIKFLTFFERIASHIDNKAIPFETVNNLFSYRFFLLVHNINVQKHLLLNPDMREYWSLIFSLHARWLAYKREAGEPIYMEEASLELTSDEFYQKLAAK